MDERETSLTAREHRALQEVLTSYLDAPPAMMCALLGVTILETMRQEREDLSRGGAAEEALR